MTELQALLADVVGRAGSLPHAELEALPEGPAHSVARAEARRTLRALERLVSAVDCARAEVAP